MSPPPRDCYRENQYSATYHVHTGQGLPWWYAVVLVTGTESKEGHVTRSADGVARKVGRTLRGESAKLPLPQEHREP